MCSAQNLAATQIRAKIAVGWPNFEIFNHFRLFLGTMVLPPALGPCVEGRNQQ
jgi:hypothetical protein